MTDIERRATVEADPVARLERVHELLTAAVAEPNRIGDDPRLRELDVDELLREQEQTTQLLTTIQRTIHQQVRRVALPR